jgi:acetyl-CoA carboxylase biotin carboxyl carrier protein
MSSKKTISNKSNSTKIQKSKSNIVGKMNFADVRELVKIVEGSQVGEIEIEEAGRKIRVSKSPTGTMMSVPSMMSHPGNVGFSPSPSSASGSSSFEVSPVTETKAGKNQVEVRSPMVGTFYQAPAPDAEPYVSVGDTIKPGQTLCIIEAMKLMNEIESEVSGKMVKICVENAKPVEYNQLLFIIEP